MKNGDEEMKKILCAVLLTGFLVAGPAGVSKATSIEPNGQIGIASTQSDTPPEPTTMLLFGLALAAITAVSRKNE